SAQAESRRLNEVIPLSSGDQAMPTPAIENRGAFRVGSNGTTILPTRSGRPATFRPPPHATGGMGDSWTWSSGSVQRFVIPHRCVVPFVEGRSLSDKHAGRNGLALLCDTGRWPLRRLRRPCWRDRR